MPAGLQVGANLGYQWSVGKGAAPGDTHCLNNHVHDQGVSHGTLFQDYDTKKKHYC